MDRIYLPDTDYFFKITFKCSHHELVEIEIDIVTMFLNMISDNNTPQVRMNEKIDRQIDEVITQDSRMKRVTMMNPCRRQM